MSNHYGKPLRLPGVPLSVCPPGVDLAEAALRQIEAAAEAKGWDEPTDMYWLYNSGDGVLVTRPPLRQSLSRMYPPAMMDLFSTQLHRARWALSPGLHSIAVVFEAWAATALMSDAAASKSLIDDADARRIYKRADRVEIRQVLLVTVAGESWLLTRVRSEGPEVQRADEGEGMVFDALRRLVAAAVRNQARASN